MDEREAARPGALDVPGRRRGRPVGRALLRQRPAEEHAGLVGPVLRRHRPRRPVGDRRLAEGGAGARQAAGRGRVGRLEPGPGRGQGGRPGVHGQHVPVLPGQRRVDRVRDVLQREAGGVAAVPAHRVPEGGGAVQGRLGPLTLPPGGSGRAAGGGGALRRSPRSAGPRPVALLELPPGLAHDLGQLAQQLLGVLLAGQRRARPDLAGDPRQGQHHDVRVDVAVLEQAHDRL